MHDERPTRRFVVGSGAVALAALTTRAQRSDAAEPRIEGITAWHDATDWTIEGRAWPDDPRARYFDRLPVEAQKTVTRAVWNLSRHSAGMCARFETDATRIDVRYTLLSGSLDMPHMPATGASGVDLYAETDDGKWRWVNVTKPNAQKVQATLLNRAAPGKRRFAAYLPLYNGVEAFEIGVPMGAVLTPSGPRKAKPIVFYGTSIMHGACASRPGMAIPAILGRRLNRATVNLGFSGNGRMHLEVGAYLARIDAALYAIDCGPNMSAAQISERTIPLVNQLRKARPDAPILLVEDRRFANAWIVPAATALHNAKHKALRGAYEKLVAGGVKHLHYLPAADLLGDDHEGTTDGSHPNDLGMMRYADAYEPVLRRVMGDA